jgi:hypothetical protein
VGTWRAAGRLTLEALCGNRDALAQQVRAGIDPVEVARVERRRQGAELAEAARREAEQQALQAAPPSPGASCSHAGSAPSCARTRSPMAVAPGARTAASRCTSRSSIACSLRSAIVPWPT